MKRIGLLLLLVVLASGSIWGEVVEIPDPNLSAALERALGKNVGDPITDVELETLTEIEYVGKGPEELQITDLTGIEHCVNLQNLNLYVNQINDISALSNLTNLTELNIGNNAISDMTAVANLTNLAWLYLGPNYISNISVLANLTGLTKLNLSNNPDLTKAQIDELQKALPKCDIQSNPKK